MMQCSMLNVRHWVIFLLELVLIGVAIVVNWSSAMDSTFIFLGVK